MCAHIAGCLDRQEASSSLAPLGTRLFSLSYSFEALFLSLYLKNISKSTIYSIAFLCLFLFIFLLFCSVIFAEDTTRNDCKIFLFKRACFSPSIILDVLNFCEFLPLVLISVKIVENFQTVDLYI